MTANIADLLRKLQDSANEKFAVIYHTRKGVVGQIIAEGDHEKVWFNAGDILEQAARIGATMISVAHNHPTGPVRPSQNDLETTFNLQDLFKVRGLKLHDHVIVGKEGAPYSMLKNGVI